MDIDTEEQEIEALVKKKFPSMLTWSFQLAVGVYILVVVLSIVDVARTSLAEMLITLLALGLLLTFINVIHFKMETARRRKNTV